jgi:hypothetical protein
MVPTSHVSTSEGRVNNKRGSGRRLLIWLSILFVSIVVVIWREELIAPLHGSDHGSRVSKLSNFARNDWGNIARDDDDEDNMMDDFASTSPKNKVSNRNKSQFKNKNRKDPTGTLRQQAIATERFKTFPIIQNTDDNIPMAAGGSVIHAADALLCRDSVLDYVINATDLKDECDGLKRAYTQTCSSDGDDDTKPEKSSRERQRRLGTQENAVIYWQQHLSRWSHYFRSWWFESSMTTHRFLSKDKNPDAGEESVTEGEQRWEFSLDDRGGNEKMFDDGNDMSGLSFDENSEFNFPATFHDGVRRKAKARRKAKYKKSGNQHTDDQENEASSPKTKPLATVDTEQDKEFKNATKAIKKPLANLALPVTTKHVSEKMLTETLMLQQNNKLMKAVVNQTNHTVTEAQADAAVSSKAVSDAAHMVSNILNDPTSVEARTCCTSILNTFHETCSVNDEEELSDRRLFVGVAVIALCGLVKSLIRHYHIRWLPEAAGCIMVGGM